MDASSQAAQGLGGVVFRKSKAYLQAMFRSRVDADRGQANPLFRGHFSPDTYRVSVEPSTQINAFIKPETLQATFTPPILPLRDEVTHWST